MTPYVAEDFTRTEQAILRRYFTDIGGPVFAVVNLPEVVKAALFARYARSSKSMRRLFIDEFVNDLDVSGDADEDATVGLQGADEMYDKLFAEYGDEAVAGLGGVHLACEQASHVLTRWIEWGRGMSYLRQSARYVAYDARLGGRYRFHRDPSVLASSLGARYVGDMDRMFDTYADLVPRLTDHFRERYPKGRDESDFVYRQSIRAEAFDTLRGLLPAASLANVGIYGSGKGYESLIRRMYALGLPEARTYAGLMLAELRKVIPSFLRGVDDPDRGLAWSAYVAETDQAMRQLTSAILPPAEAADDKSSVTLVDFDPDGEVKTVTAMLYPYCHEPEEQIEDRVRLMSVEERIAIMRAYVGDRAERRHRPGRALERTAYHFDVLGDYGAFRDLQRSTTVEWQGLTPFHGYIRPDAVEEAGVGPAFDEAMERSAALYHDLSADFPEQAAYAVSMAYRVRYSVQMNAREAMHLLEYRSSSDAHPSDRLVAQQMHEQLSEVAGHRALAAMMMFVDHSDERERVGASTGNALMR
ncbi:MAG TPA: FAD-dependent thymidylate synthase [Microthrixaceae bacterium]|nr:FAD-dependent thymidylate synthase [Microthrixaceae bacterium]